MASSRSDLTSLDDGTLDAEHQARLDARDEARAQWALHRDEVHGRALAAARVRVDETQAELNARRGAPPAQTIGG